MKYFKFFVLLLILSFCKVNAMSPSKVIISDIGLNKKIAGTESTDTKNLELYFLKVLLNKDETYTGDMKIEVRRGTTRLHEVTLQTLTSTEDNLKEDGAAYKFFNEKTTYSYPGMNGTEPEIVEITEQEVQQGKKYYNKSSGKYYVYYIYIDTRNGFDENVDYFIKFTGDSLSKVTSKSDPDFCKWDTYDDQRCIIKQSESSDTIPNMSDNLKDRFGIEKEINNGIKFEIIKQCDLKDDKFSFRTKIIYHIENTPLNLTPEQKTALSTIQIKSLKACKYVNYSVPYDTCFELYNNKQLYFPSGSDFHVYKTATELLGEGRTNDKIKISDLEQSEEYNLMLYYSYVYKNQEYTTSHASEFLGVSEVCDNSSLKEIEEVVKQNEAKKTTFKTGEYRAVCGLLTKELVDFMYGILNLVRVLGIVLVIILGSLDFAKAVASSDQDANKKAFKDFKGRLIAIAVLFLLPILIKTTLNLTNITGDNPDDPLCEKTASNN